MLSGGHKSQPYHKTVELPPCVLREEDIRKIVELMGDALGERSVKDSLQIATTVDDKLIHASTVDDFLCLVEQRSMTRLRNIAISASSRTYGRSGPVTPHLPRTVPWGTQWVYGPPERDAEIGHRIIEFRCLPMWTSLFVNGEGEVWFEGTIAVLSHLIETRCQWSR